MEQYLGGKASVSLNGVKIPAHLISDEGVTTTLTEGTREVATMAGTFRQPSGTYDEAGLSFNVVLPSMFYLKNLFPEAFTASTDRPTIAGQTVFGGNDCTIRANTPVVVHYECDENSDNDVYLPNGSVQASLELVQNASDPVSVAITVNALPDDNGVIARLGTGSLTEPTLWNPATEAYEALAS